MTYSQRDIYRHHHSHHREAGFSVLKDDRGKLLRNLIGEGKTILDIGCRDGALTKFFLKGNTVLGVDIDDIALDLASKLGIETMKLDLNGNWSELKGRKFDVVVAGEVLEHLYYPDQVLEKMKSLLNLGGMLMGSVPNAFSLKNRLRYLLGTKRHTPLSDPTHINQFSEIELQAILRRYFKEVEIRGLGRYQTLAKLSPNLFAFDLFFMGKL
ncbi:MAG: class I SAM-dependent methyltransferase [Patescibacteria group bacterium]